VIIYEDKGEDKNVRQSLKGTRVAAVYIHIPFCKQKCIYCDFNSFPGFAGTYDSYTEALVDEIDIKAKDLRDCVIDTIYIGGGTPTLFKPDRIAYILGHVDRCFSINAGVEVSIEANPETLFLEDMIALRAAGINRFSIGFQSLDDECLETLGRRHSARRAIVSFLEAREAGFKNINVDLIFGIPGQSLANWALNLEQAVALNPDHISCYGLTVEPGTLLKKRIDIGELDKPEDDIQADMMTYTRESLLDSGYEHYEISNFAKPDNRCKHNLTYWNNDDYIGFGAGAHSKIGDVRYNNIGDPEDYIKAARTGASTAFIQDKTILSPSERLSDAVFLGLRKMDGVVIDEINARYECDLVGTYGKEIDDLVDNGLLLMREGTIRLSSKGLLLGNEVFSRFV
jgi:oxygen-independent coproporphyrinogen-3 oxidase